MNFLFHKKKEYDPLRALPPGVATDDENRRNQIALENLWEPPKPRKPQGWRQIYQGMNLLVRAILTSN